MALPTLHHSCPKCGAAAVRPTYCPGAQRLLKCWRSAYEMFQEHLHFCCLTCAYEWLADCVRPGQVPAPMFDTGGIEEGLIA